MSLIEPSDTPLAQVLHAILHEISGRFDMPADDVAEVVELYEDLKDKRGIRLTRRDGLT